MWLKSRENTHTPLGKKRESEKTSNFGHQIFQAGLYNTNLRQENQENVHFLIFPEAWKCISLAGNEFSVHLPHSPLQGLEHTHPHTHTPSKNKNQRNTENREKCLLSVFFLEKFQL